MRPPTAARARPFPQCRCWPPPSQRLCNAPDLYTPARPCIRRGQRLSRRPSCRLRLIRRPPADDRLRGKALARPRPATATPSGPKKARLAEVSEGRDPMISLVRRRTARGESGRGLRSSSPSRRRGYRSALRKPAPRSTRRDRLAPVPATAHARADRTPSCAAASPRSCLCSMPSGRSPAIRTVSVRRCSKSAST
jgi:hypothetical protein